MGAGPYMESAKRTPLYKIHVSLGAKMVPFGGYEMPVSYPSGIAAEHRAVRDRVGVFDVSHMGEFEVSGPDRNAFVQRVTCNDVGALTPGQAQYSAILTDQGTFVDDCLVYRFEDRVMLVVNAANIAPDWQHIVAQKRGANVRLRDISDETGLLAVQGPAAETLLAPLTPVGVAMIPYYHFARARSRACSASSPARGTPARTGSSCMPAPPTRRRCGMRWSAWGGPSRAASARATRCGSRRDTRCTAATSTPASHPTRRASAGS